MIRQENAGRFRSTARRHRSGDSDLVLLIDSRITITSGSISFLRSEVIAERDV